MDKYVIIDRESIEGRITELENKVSNSLSQERLDFKEYQTLIRILSQSTPLIPEIVKSFNAGERYGWDAVDGIENIDRMKEIIPLVSLETYVSDLKF